METTHVIEKKELGNPLPFLNEKIIAYIGNKRKLLKFLEKNINAALKGDTKNKSFLDLFAGSGSVSRLAKYMGMRVHSNDWEEYSYILNSAHLGINPEDEKQMFKKLGGIDETIEKLNTLPDLKESESYIAKYYAPKSDENPNLKNERLFYTSYNAKTIDKTRVQIEKWKNKMIINQKEYHYLLASLIYEAATHSNTSGVFKGFHNGFGGKNKDALKRIMGEIRISKLPLYEGAKGHVYKMNANDLVKKLKNTSFDIAYLDPPYNQHQYGSNYHLLNTIALWDKPHLNEKIYIDGKKTNKSAIRKDWIKTRSDYCYKESATSAFEKLIEGINARKIILSYSTDGIIDIDKILEILERKGKLDIVTEEYTRYPGAKQSIVNEVKNVEYLFLIDTQKQKGQSKRGAIRKKLLKEDIRLMLNRTFKNGLEKGVHFRKEGKEITIELLYNVRVENKESILKGIENQNETFLKDFLLFLKENTVENKLEEINIFLEKLKSPFHDADIVRFFITKIAKLYNKLNGKKGEGHFTEITLKIFERLNEIIEQYGEDVIPKQAGRKILSVCEKKINENAIEEKSSMLVTHYLLSFQKYFT